MISIPVPLLIYCALSIGCAWKFRPARNQICRDDFMERPMGYTLESGSLDRGGEMDKGVCEWDQIDTGGRFLLEIT